MAYRKTYKSRILTGSASRVAKIYAARGLARAAKVGVLRTGGFGRYGTGFRTAVMRGRGTRGETKAVDLDSILAACDTTGTITLLNGIQEGAGFNNRIGRKVAMRSLHIRGTVTGTNVATTPGLARAIIVYDKQTNGAAPVWADVVTSVTQAAGASSTVFGHINLNNRDRFVVLMDWVQTMPGQTAVSGVNNAAPFPNACEMTINRFIKLKNLETQFNATANPATVAQITTGSLYLLTFGSEPAATGFTFEFGSRLRFQDN